MLETINARVVYTSPVGFAARFENPLPQLMVRLASRQSG